MENGNTRTMKHGPTDKRVTPGKVEPTRTTYSTFECATCGFRGNTGCCKALDGEEGLWCYKCHAAGVKSPLKTVELPDERWVPGYTEVKCCGTWLVCDGFTTTCGRCGRDYNWNGTQLAHRLQWGEETGETADDILRG